MLRRFEKEGSSELKSIIMSYLYDTDSKRGAGRKTDKIKKSYKKREPDASAPLRLSPQTSAAIILFLENELYFW